MSHPEPNLEKAREPFEVPQKGRIFVSGELPTRFWVKALALSEDVDKARIMMGDRIERKWAAVPCIGEYSVGDKFEWIYLLVVEVDVLGIKGGNGIIYFTTPEHRQEIISIRDKQADNLVEGFNRGFDEVIVLDEKREGYEELQSDVRQKGETDQKRPGS